MVIIDMGTAYIHSYVSQREMYANLCECIHVYVDAHKLLTITVIFKLRISLSVDSLTPYDICSVNWMIMISCQGNHARIFILSFMHFNNLHVQLSRACRMLMLIFSDFPLVDIMMAAKVLVEDGKLSGCLCLSYRVLRDAL